MWEIRLYGSRRTEKCALFGHTLGYSTGKNILLIIPVAYQKHCDVLFAEQARTEFCKNNPSE
jgi:hypothetical protein